MKKGLRKKQYFYIKMTVVLILLIVCVLFWHTRFVQKIAVRQSFSILNDSRDQIGQMITNEMKNEQDHLDSAENLLDNLLDDPDQNQDQIVKVLNASSANQNYTHWELCLPDERVIRNDGSVTELGANYSFEERIQKGFVVSERRTALRDGKTQIIMLSKCIFNDTGECTGILSSVIDLDRFAEEFFDISKNLKPEIILFERGTGDILVDSWNEGEPLGNIDDAEEGRNVDAANGFDWEQVRASYKAKKEGNAAFHSKIKHEVVYMSYAPIDYSDWELLIFAPDSVCMKSANQSQNAAYLAMLLILADFMVFFVILVIEETQRQRLNNEKEIALQAALEKANRANAAKTDFLSRMSHDIRTPLNGIIGYLDLESENKKNPEVLSRYRKNARVAADHLLSLINDILNMSKLEDGKVELAHEAFDLTELAADILGLTEIHAREAGITLIYPSIGVNMPYPYVYGSPLHVRQIFVNILNNAVKYNKPDGKIFCRVEGAKQEENEIFYTCIIQDTGIGMSREFLEHLFDPFAQEKVDARSVYKGTGLGMAIVKSLVDKMGGTIEVTSEPEKGSLFRVTLPFEIASQGDIEKKAGMAKDASIRDVRILLVEDNVLNIEIIAELLREQGADVTCANNGQEAVALFADHPPGTFDVILMDILMPVMDGFQATREIRGLEREDASEIPIIALTANAFTEDMKKSREAGMDAHLSKPINMGIMIQTIVELLDKSKDRL